MVKMKSAVSATLAGALAVGMVPAMALADDDVQLLVAEEKYDVAKGTVTAAVDYAGNAVDLTEDVVFTATDKDNGKAIVKITEFKTATGTVVNMADTTTAADYTVAYYEVSGSSVRDWSGKDGVVSISEAVKAGAYNWAAGEYYVTVRSNGADGNIALALKFEVEADDIEGAYLYEAAKDLNGKDVYTDTEFAYTGKALELAVAVDGKPLDSDDYDVAFYKKGSNDALTAGVVDAGSYIAEIDGKGNYEGYEEQISFDVAVADLSKATVVVNADHAYREADSSKSMTLEYDAATSILSVNGGTDLLDELNLKFVSASNGKTANLKNEPGAYTYKLYAPEISAGKANPNITGETTVTYVRYEDTAAFEYDGEDVPASIDFEDYDEADFVAVDDKGNELASTVKYYKVVGGKDVEVSQITGYGTYKAVLAVDSAKESYKWGGAETLTIKVDEVEIKVNENGFIKFDGKVVTYDQAVYYNGSDFAEEIEVLVLDNKNKALTAGVDYDVVITNADGDVVTEMVKSGVYTVAIKENADSVYKLTGEKEIKLTIKKAPATAVIGDQISGIDGGQFFYQGGEAINPIAGWVSADGIDADSDPDAIEVPASAYKLTITGFKAEGAKKWADPEDVPADFAAAGDYEFTIADADAKDDYVVTDKAYEVAITATNVFVDVKADAWYADEVYDIATAGIMGGYGNGKFGPNDNTERQDLAVVVFRLLNERARLTNGQDWDEIVSAYMGMFEDEIYLPYADTNGKAYYAVPVWYASKNGIMTGYSDGSKEFGVGDDVTREQVATVLYRISESGLYGKKATLLASVLDAYADADEVSGYAVEAMTWAVENGIFGVSTQYLNPTDPISRAELAAVIMRYVADAGVEVEDPLADAEVVGNDDVEKVGTINAGVHANGGTFSGLSIVDDTDAAVNLRALYITGMNEDVVVEDSYLDGTYALNISGASASHSLVVENTTLKGWTSYGKVKEAAFTDCVFGWNSENAYAHLRPYADTTLTNCAFAAGFTIGADAGGSGATIELVNCTYDGVVVTAANFADTLGKGFISGTYGLKTNGYTVKVDGVAVVL